MKRVILWVFVLVVCISMLAVFSLASCKSEEAVTEEAPEEKAEEAAEEAAPAEEAEEAEEVEEIEFSLFTQAPGAYPEIFPVIVESFESKHPGVTVDMRVIGYGEYQSTLSAMLAADEAPDVFLTGQGGLLWGLAEAGEVLELTPYLDANDGEWRKQMYDYIPDLLVWEDGVYAIAASLNNMQVAINKGLLEEYGLDVPETTEDLIQMAADLEGTGISPIGFATADQWAAIDLFVMFVYQLGGGEELREADLGKEPWTGAGKAIFVKAFETIKELTDTGVFLEGASAMNYHEDVLPLWMQESTVMAWPAGNFMIQDIPEELDADTIWFPNIPEGERILTGGTALVWCASSKTEYPELAIELLKELTTQETYELMFKFGIAPAGKLEKEVTSDYPLADKVNSEQEAALDRFIYTPEHYQGIAVAVQSVMAGDITPEGAVEQLQEISDSVYGE